jgi:hypothetical protein
MNRHLRKKPPTFPLAVPFYKLVSQIERILRKMTHPHLSIALAYTRHVDRRATSDRLRQPSLRRRAAFVASVA